VAGWDENGYAVESSPAGEGGNDRRSTGSASPGALRSQSGRASMVAVRGRARRLRQRGPPQKKPVTFRCVWTTSPGLSPIVWGSWALSGRFVLRMSSSFWPIRPGRNIKMAIAPHERPGNSQQVWADGRVVPILGGPPPRAWTESGQLEVLLMFLRAVMSRAGEDHRTSPVARSALAHGLALIGKCVISGATMAPGVI